MARARGANALMALAFESTYGTAPASGFSKMSFVSSDVGTSQGLVPDDQLGQGRDPSDPTQDVIDNGGSLTLPVGVEAFGIWLKLLMGAPTSAGAGPYTHTFTSGASALPSASIEIGHPEVPFYEMHSGVMANELTLEMQRGQGSLLTANLGLMGQGSATATSSSAGTLADVSQERFSHFNGAVSRNNSALGEITMAKLMFSNQLEPIEAIRADGKIGGFDPGVCAVTGELRVRFADTTLLDQANQGASCDLDLLWQIDANKSLAIAVPRIFIERPKLPVSGPNGIEQTYSFIAARQSNGDPMMTAVLTNSRADYS
jgi:hypothetical protein